MKFPKILFFITLISACLFSSCETDIDITAPYKATPVIFGILDNSVDTQFFRVNKTFLGDGNAINYAAVADSSEYDPEEVQVVLKKYRGNNLQNTINLQSLVKTSREPGVFYNRDIRYYYTTEPLLDEDEEIPSILSTIRYDIEATIRGVEYTASTAMVNIRFSDVKYPTPNENNISAPFVNPTIANLNFLNINNYSEPEFRLNNSVNVERYELEMRFIADIVYQDGSILHNQFFTYKIGSTSGISQTSETRLRFNSGAIYEATGRFMENYSNVELVKIERLEFSLIGGNKDFDTYLNIHEPSSSIATINPEYSNIEGALGLFAAKSIYKFDAGISNTSVVRFGSDPFTSGFSYCGQWLPNSSTASCN